MTADFHAERRMVTATARSEKCWTDEEISQMRTELRDQYYEKMKYSNRRLPQLPKGRNNISSTLTGVSTINTSDESLKVADTEETADIRAQLKE